MDACMLYYGAHGPIKQFSQNEFNENLSTDLIDDLGASRESNTEKHSR